MTLHSQNLTSTAANGAAAKVPKVCPHSLRGTLASGAAASGVRLNLISAVLGHRSSRMTTQHYIRPGVMQAAELERGLAALVQRRQTSTPSP